MSHDNRTNVTYAICTRFYDTPNGSIPIENVDTLGGLLPTLAINGVLMLWCLVQLTAVGVRNYRSSPRASVCRTLKYFFCGPPNCLARFRKAFYLDDVREKQGPDAFLYLYFMRAMVITSGTMLLPRIILLICTQQNLFGQMVDDEDLYARTTFINVDPPKGFILYGGFFLLEIILNVIFFVHFMGTIIKETSPAKTRIVKNALVYVKDREVKSDSEMKSDRKHTEEQKLEVFRKRGHEREAKATKFELELTNVLKLAISELEEKKPVVMEIVDFNEEQAKLENECKIAAELEKFFSKPENGDYFSVFLQCNTQCNWFLASSDCCCCDCCRCKKDTEHQTLRIYYQTQHYYLKSKLEEETNSNNHGNNFIAIIYCSDAETLRKNIKKQAAKNTSLKVSKFKACFQDDLNKESMDGYSSVFCSIVKFVVLVIIMIASFGFSLSAQVMASLDDMGKLPSIFYENLSLQLSPFQSILRYDSTLAYILVRLLLFIQGKLRNVMPKMLPTKPLCYSTKELQIFFCVYISSILPTLLSPFFWVRTRSKPECLFFVENGAPYLCLMVGLALTDWLSALLLDDNSASLSKCQLEVERRIALKSFSYGSAYADVFFPVGITMMFANLCPAMAIPSLAWLLMRYLVDRHRVNLYPKRAQASEEGLHRLALVFLFVSSILSSINTTLLFAMRINGPNNLIYVALSVLLPLHVTLIVSALIRSQKLSAFILKLCKCLPVPGIDGGAENDTSAGSADTTFESSFPEMNKRYTIIAANDLSRKIKQEVEKEIKRNKETYGTKQPAPKTQLIGDETQL